MIFKKKKPVESRLEKKNKIQLLDAINFVNEKIKKVQKNIIDYELLFKLLLFASENYNIISAIM